MEQKLLKQNYWKPFLFLVHRQNNIQLSVFLLFLSLIRDLFLLVGKKSSEQVFQKTDLSLQKTSENRDPAELGHYNAAFDIVEL